MSSRLVSNIYRSSGVIPRQQLQYYCCQQQQQSINIIVRRWAHSVRLIALQDFPHGKAYKGDVVTVKAGYARNYLIPKKVALYATPQNFDRLGMVDPDYETAEQRVARLQRESFIEAGKESYLKEADLLKKYLKNKVVGQVIYFSYWWRLILFCFVTIQKSMILSNLLFVVPYYFILLSIIPSSRYGEMWIPIVSMPYILEW
jgi:hypothetical protein